jgi:hypothetical protein
MIPLCKETLYERETFVWLLIFADYPQARYSTYGFLSKIDIITA